MRGKGFANIRLPRCPLPADAETRDNAKDDQELKVRRQSAQEGADAVRHNCPLEDALASVFIGENTKDDSSYCRGRKRCAEDVGEFDVREVEFPTDGNQEKGVEDKVVEVEHPTGPAHKQNPVVRPGRLLSFVEKSGRHAASIPIALEEIKVSSARVKKKICPGVH